MDPRRNPATVNHPPVHRQHDWPGEVDHWFRLAQAEHRRATCYQFLFLVVSLTAITVLTVLALWER
jgi:hypothetical protein